MLEKWRLGIHATVGYHTFLNLFSRNIKKQKLRTMKKEIRQSWKKRNRVSDFWNFAAPALINLIKVPILKVALSAAKPSVSQFFLI